MQAHGGGLILVNNTYYLHGENKLDGSAFQSINCYSSQNLVEWKYEGKTLSVGQGPSDLATGRVVERPHVLWNEGTRKFVMVSFVVLILTNRDGGVEKYNGRIEVV